MSTKVPLTLCFLCCASEGCVFSFSLVRLNQLVEEFTFLKTVFGESEGSVTFEKCKRLLKELPDRYLAP